MFFFKHKYYLPFFYWFSMHEFFIWHKKNRTFFPLKSKLTPGKFFSKFFLNKRWAEIYWEHILFQHNSRFLTFWCRKLSDRWHILHQKCPNLTSEKTRDQFFFYFREKTNAFSVLCHVPIGISDHLEPARHAVAQLYQVISAELHGPQLLDGGDELGHRQDILFFNRFFMWFQQFSIGFGSVLFPGQSMTWKGYSARKALIRLEASHGAPSWRKCVQPCSSMNLSRWSSNTVW